MRDDCPAGQVSHSHNNLVAIQQQSLLQIPANLVLNQYCRLRLWGSTGEAKKCLFAKRMAYGPVENIRKMAIFRISRLLCQKRNSDICVQNSEI